MKLLENILEGLKIKMRKGEEVRNISSIAFDSREVQPGDMFVAIKGSLVDGHDYIPAAVQKGATVVVCKHFPASLTEGVYYLQVKNPSYALGIMASNYYGNPSRNLKLVGVTGTNGKTTIATLSYQLFDSLGYACGLLSTIENRIGNEIVAATHTTPDPLRLNALLQRMVEQGIEYVFMEVSSHAVDQSRIAGLHFAGGVFTNITHDHLDYHKTYEKYIYAKKKFFDGLPGSSFALSNLDDRNGLLMIQDTAARKYVYALKHPADFKALIIENSFEGLHLRIGQKELYARLIGTFNAYNLLAIYGIAILLGQAEEEVLQAMSLLSSAEGRFEVIREGGKVAIVDYAHTPDALDNVLKTINAIKTRRQSLITVVGAGGDRDKSKRPEMADTAVRLSDTLILTSDNPRSEDPERIIREMAAGIPEEYEDKVLHITQREQAIKTALRLAKEGDIVLVAGKGHEKYQEIKGVKYPFDDKEIVTKYLIKNSN